MATQEIPQRQWQQFLDQFSQMHQGWHATISVEDRKDGPQRIADDMPLQGISFDSKGSEKGSIEIAVGDEPDAFTSHLIEHPKSVRVMEMQQGAQASMEIESEDEPVTLLTLRMAKQLPH